MSSQNGDLKNDQSDLGDKNIFKETIGCTQVQVFKREKIQNGMPPIQIQYENADELIEDTIKSG